MMQRGSCLHAKILLTNCAAAYMDGAERFATLCSSGNTWRLFLMHGFYHAGELQAAQAAARQAAGALSHVEAAEAEASGVVARLERKVALLTKERNVLKEIVASYDAEEANLSGDSLWAPRTCGH